MSKSDALEGELLSFLYRTTTTLAGATGATKPANRYLAIFSADPTDAGSGAEITGNGIVRVAIPVADASWAAPATNGAAMRISNATVLAFPETTGNAGTATHIGIVTSASGAFTLLHHAVMTTARALTSAGITLSFPIGSITIDES